MSLDITAIQQTLATDGLDGWLLYDFHGSNPIAVRLAGLEGVHTTRRWYYFVPVAGAPRKLVHAVEPSVLGALPGDTHLYAGRGQLEGGLKQLLKGLTVVAMEYSPNCDIPYISRVDGGTIDMIRALGVRVVSSGDLVGRFEAAWDAAAVASHREASERLYRIKDRAFGYIGARLSAGVPVHEFDVQQSMMEWFREEGLVTDAPPIVAAQENAANPHYSPTAAQSRAIKANELVLLDLWGKLGAPRSVYADITWTGFGGTPPDEMQRVFEVVASGRDAALTRVQTGMVLGRPVQGWEVDRAARDVITAAGFGDRFVHRTGHSLGEEVHGNGVHMDDYETHDDRTLLVGTGFTIEPGIYLPGFGIRSEINVVVGAGSAEATGPCQHEIAYINTRT
ncbi:MAG: M24 family metallopeptidase [Vicinamibacterales bacterium]